jgi:hypothetical protein
VFLEATRQHWLTTHVARKEGSDNFKMDWGLTDWREIKAGGVIYADDKNLLA